MFVFVCCPKDGSFLLYFNVHMSVIVIIPLLERKQMSKLFSPLFLIQHSVHFHFAPFLIRSLLVTFVSRSLPLDIYTTLASPPSPHPSPKLALEPIQSVINKS